MIPLNAILVEDRHRTDLGDLGELAESIERLGLLHPIVVNKNGRLIAGQRRLEAYRLLGRTEIPTTIVEGLDEAAALLTAERDENTCRLDMTPTEKVALGLALEGLERPKAREREARPGDPRRGHNTSSDPGTGASSNPHETRETVGAALGMSGATYDRAKRVVLAKDDPDPAVREVAEREAAHMDATGNIRGSADSVSRARGTVFKTPPPSPDLGKRGAIQQTKMLAQIVQKCSHITDITPHIDHDKINQLPEGDREQWLQQLRQTRTALSRLIAAL